MVVENRRSLLPLFALLLCLLSSSPLSLFHFYRPHESEELVEKAPVACLLPYPFYLPSSWQSTMILSHFCLSSSKMVPLLHAAFECRKSFFSLSTLRPATFWESANIMMGRTFIRFKVIAARRRRKPSPSLLCSIEGSKETCELRDSKGRWYREDKIERGRRKKNSF